MSPHFWFSSFYLYWTSLDSDTFRFLTLMHSLFSYDEKGHSVNSKDHFG